MTLYELWLLIVKRWKLMVLLPVLCAAACFAYLMVDSSGVVADSYKATARIVVNSQTPGVAGLAASEGRQYLYNLYGDLLYSDEETEEELMTISTNGNTDTMTVSVQATGPNDAECVKAANEVAEAAKAKAEEVYADPDEMIYSTRVTFAASLEPATMAETKASKDDSSGKAKYLLIAILAGLFVAICLAVVIDLRKRPLKTAASVQDAIELPVLEMLPAANGERLLANVRFAAKKENLASAYIVPTGDQEAARETRDLLVRTVEEENAQAGAQPLIVECGTPLSESMQSAYAARERDAVVVTVRQWIDTLPQLESTVAELKLADVNLVGIVFAKEKMQ